MLWEIALMMVAITFMIVNIWSIVINAMVLKKMAPFMEKMMELGCKSLKYMEKEFDDDLKD